MLMLHTNRGSALATEDDLLDLPVPEVRGPLHRPVPHAELVASLRATAVTRGYGVVRQEVGLARGGKRLFGVLDLTPPTAHGLHGDHGPSIGFRNSTDETLAIRVVAGTRVFVCDNLALSGDMIALKRRNTRGLDLMTALAAGFDRYLLHAEALEEQIVVLQENSISDQQARSKLYALFAERVLPMRVFTAVHRNYFKPDKSMTDCQPRTWWALHNSCSRALKLMSRQRAFETNVALGYAFGMTGDERQ